MGLMQEGLKLVKDHQMDVVAPLPIWNSRYGRIKVKGHTKHAKYGSNV